MDLTWKPSPWVLALLVSEGPVQAAKEKSNQQSCPAVKYMNHNDQLSVIVPGVQ